MFSSTDPGTQQGLLGAAAALFKAGGPSFTPVSVGQGLGDAIGAFQQGQTQAQQQAMRALQIKQAQMELGQQQAAQEMQARIRNRLATDPQNPQAMAPQAQAGAPAMPDATQQQPMASAMPGGPMSPKTGGPDWMQAWQASQPQDLPGAASMGTTAPAATAPAAAQPDASNLTQQLTARLTHQAQIYSEEGDFATANKLYEQAAKFLPEVNKIEVGMSNGKPVNVITYKDGRQEVSQFAPKPDIHFADDGQHTAIPMNGYTGQAMGPGLTRQATPGEVLQNRQAGARLAFDREQANAADEPGKPNETMAKQIAFYKAAPLGQFSLNKPWGQATMDRVMELNPQYDAAQYAPRAAALRTYGAGGKEALGIDSINIGMNHVATLRELALAQKNGNVQLFNKIANQWSSATGQPAPTNLRMAADMVSPEVVKAVAGVAGTGEERAHFAQSLTGNGSYSPDQIIGATGEVQKLFAGRLSEKKRAYERTTQLDNFESMLSPAAQALLQQKAAPSATPAGQFSVTLPDGRTVIFKTAKDLANFKLEAGIR